MAKKFLDKYQDYCKDKERREEVFNIMQHEDENLEDYIEQFTYNLQREKKGDLAPDVGTYYFIFILLVQRLEPPFFLNK
jgi:hypothetical protein